ncbi:metal-binding protein [Deinococcus sonorensis]|uniref:Metal-binding protein n=2 Tax=Deinococcus sonorensis TaxID=309891 RepID=A0AAU7UEF8_9DEIO
MPSGRVHNLINIAAYALLSAGALYLTHVPTFQAAPLVITPVQAASFTLAYAAGTFLLSPDLDLAEGKVDSKRHWGVLGFLWVPYGLLFSHRGFSHTWLLGPLTRLVYLALMVLLVWGLLHLLVPQLPLPWLPQPLSLKVLLPALIGYYLSQWLHLIADGVRPDHGLRRGHRKVRSGLRKFR